MSAVVSPDLREQDDSLGTALRRSLWLVLVLQLVAVFFVTSPWIRGADSHEYLQLAGAIADGHFQSNTAAGLEPEALRPPGYPAFLAFVNHILGLPLGAAIAIQLAVYLACIALIAHWLRSYRYAAELFLG